VDLCLKDVTPSPGLREWSGHDPARWEQFQERCRQELREKKDAVQLLKQKEKEGTVTLVYAARDVEHNGALAPKKLLQDHSHRLGIRSTVEGTHEQVSADHSWGGAIGAKRR
jgi:uncharacterized protein YeaO (DUF488 family)